MLNRYIEFSHTVEIKVIKTLGDENQKDRLSEIGGKGLFSKKIEIELLDKKIDLAVQALKDLGEFTNSPQGREDKQNYEKQIDDAIVQSKAQNNIANFFDDGSDFGEDVTPGGFLKRGGDIQTLKDSGYLGDDPRKVDNLASALVTLNPFSAKLIAGLIKSSQSFVANFS